MLTVWQRELTSGAPQSGIAINVIATLVVLGLKVLGTNLLGISFYAFKLAGIFMVLLALYGYNREWEMFSDITVCV